MNWIFTKNDLKYNLEKIQRKEENIIFVTGLIGSGKTTLAQKLALEHNAIIVMQDWFSRGNYYNSPEMKIITEKFIKKYPETKIYFDNNLWRCKKEINKKKRNYYRKKYDNIMLEHVKDNPNQLFIFEGSFMFHCYEHLDLRGKPVVVIGTSVLSSFWRKYKRDFDHSSMWNILFHLKYSIKTLVKVKSLYINGKMKLKNFILHHENVDLNDYRQ